MSKIYPISFSIPKEKIVECVPNKTRLLSPLIPGELSTYTFDSEKEYYKQYQDSLFAITKKKAGWDCMRHYEILANGCIPIFLDLENCPINTLTHLPKKCLLYCKKLYETKYKYKSFSKDIVDELYNVLEYLLEYTRKFLTTESIVLYMLNSVGLIPKRILFISSTPEVDYLNALVLHGFKNILKENCVDFPKVEYIYKSCDIKQYLSNFMYNKNLQIPNNFYGGGYTYSCLLDILDNSDINNRDIQKVITEIENDQYDMIIFSQIHRKSETNHTNILYNILLNKIPHDRIIFLCGEDEHVCNYITNISHHIFIRELN